MNTQGNSYMYCAVCDDDRIVFAKIPVSCMRGFITLCFGYEHTTYDCDAFDLTDVSIYMKEFDHGNVEKKPHFFYRSGLGGESINFVRGRALLIGPDIGKIKKLLEESKELKKEKEGENEEVK